MEIAKHEPGTDVVNLVLDPRTGVGASFRCDNADEAHWAAEAINMACRLALGRLKRVIREPTLEESLAECRKWRMTDAEVEELLK